LYSQTGTLNYRSIFYNEEVLRELASTPSYIAGLSAAGLIGLLLFIGAVGKSAQFPLHVWLPDAMEGPTPVSAMIHAATMVSAGVYMVIRIFPLLTAGADHGVMTSTMLIISIIGAGTAIFAATIAVAQNDIKRVLAYSTISQLGYMMAAVGIGAYVAAAFHLITHAFFKALLFLGSGSVIHGMEHGVLHTGEDIDPQNMLNMGGLRKKMPITFWTFLIGGFALSGFPLITAGFWSKDEILSEAFGNAHWIVFITLALAALLTAFYTMRQITLTFLGKPRTKSAEHAQETPWTMTLPLVILAVFAVAAGWVGIPEHFPVLGGIIPNWFHSFVGSTLLEEPEAVSFNAIPLLTSLIVALGGLWLGWTVYKKFSVGETDPLENWLGSIYPVLKNKYYVDELYDVVFIKPAIWFSEVFTYLWMDRKIIDGILHGIAFVAYQLGSIFRNYFDKPIVNGSGDLVANVTKSTGRSLRVMQTGRIQQYMVMALFGFITISGLMFYLIQRLILR
ncbi:MAG: NADH-quinone oxidoreductase subunit L, partial [Anaerolineales bacterium]